MLMRFRISLFFIIFLAGALFSCPVRADGDPPLDPLHQPRPRSSYGMDLMGPGWQWTFPREEAWPRLDGALRVDLLDDLVRKSWGAGVRSVRVSTWWCMVEPERDSYDWEALDDVFQIASNYGLSVIPEIYYTPDWAALGTDVAIQCVDKAYPRNLPPQNMDDWSDFMADMVNRYGIHGKDQVHEWEIWNEPDLWEFWYTPSDPVNDNVPMYSRLVQRAKEQIAANDVNGRLLLGGMSDINGPEFLQRLMALEGDLDVRDDVDIVTLHVFSDHIRKISSLKAALGDNEFDLWVTELNYWGWTEDASPQMLSDLYALLAREGVTQSFWFKSWTTDWGPGIFLDQDPLWEPKPFTPSAFYHTFKQQTFPHALSGHPVVQEPAPNSLLAPRPEFVWERPDPGDFPIAGYKLQVDDSLYRGTPYFTSPELDAWVPAGELHFLPLQMIGGRGVAAPSGPVSPQAPPPTTPLVHYQPQKNLSPGVYYWRVAAVDVRGNVGPYSPVRPLVISAGDERVFLPAQIQP